MPDPGVSFFVPGIPVPKGSGRAFYNKKAKKALVIQDNLERQKPWVSLISTKAEQAGIQLTKNGVAIVLEFRMPRPKADYNKKGLKPTAPFWHVKTPDIDKLARAVLDALSSIAYYDDRQVYRLEASKHYSEHPGVMIFIYAANEGEIVDAEFPLNT